MTPWRPARFAFSVTFLSIGASSLLQMSLAPETLPADAGAGSMVIVSAGFVFLGAYLLPVAIGRPVASSRQGDVAADDAGPVPRS